MATDFCKTDNAAICQTYASLRYKILGHALQNHDTTKDKKIKINSVVRVEELSKDPDQDNMIIKIQKKQLPERDKELPLPLTNIFYLKNEKKTENFNIEKVEPLDPRNPDSPMNVINQ